ncbi:MAG: hypothetical protein EOO21_01075 [Comamonadaceae bacterium]|nr:MAG: hypothetical protein EOO21_01075 [Comamonadaceae bacterium]
MASALENLSGPGKALRAEPPDEAETQGLLRTGLARLKDAGNVTATETVAAALRNALRGKTRLVDGVAADGAQRAAHPTKPTEARRRPRHRLAATSFPRSPLACSSSCIHKA